MMTWSGPVVEVDDAVEVVADRSDENGFMSGFQMASPKQIAATMAMPAMAMTMSFLKFTPCALRARCRLSVDCGFAALSGESTTRRLTTAAMRPPQTSTTREAQPTDNRQRAAKHAQLPTTDNAREARNH
jgi:hypothetical protein